MSAQNLLVLIAEHRAEVVGSDLVVGLGHRDVLHEELDPLRGIQLIERVAGDDLGKQLVYQLANPSDGLVLSNIFEIKNAFGKGRMENVDAALNDATLSHEFLFFLLPPLPSRRDCDELKAIRHF